MEDMKTKAQ